MAEDLDKKELYGEYLKGEKAKRDLYLRGAHKALDIAEEDMNVSTEVNKIGLGWRELLVVLGTGLAGYGLYNFYNSTSEPADSSYEVLFYDKDGNQIEVPRLPID